MLVSVDTYHTDQCNAVFIYMSVYVCVCSHSCVEFGVVKNIGY